jgi:uncharacterized protein with von Willebrand factor type A (vWA) domain
MFVTFFHELKSTGVPVTLREYLTLMEAMQADLAGRRVEDTICRIGAMKDERNLDKFDRVFGHVSGASTRWRRRWQPKPGGVAKNREST